MSASRAGGSRPPARDGRRGNAERSQPVSLVHPAGHHPSPRNGWSRPEYFEDLNLDYVVDAVGERSAHPGRTMALLHSPVADSDVIRFRQDVFKDLANPRLRERARRFTRLVSQVRHRLVSLAQIEDPRERQGWFLEAVASYCAAVDDLADALTSGCVRSDGLALLSETLTRYRRNGSYPEMASEMTAQYEALGRIRYCVRIDRGRVEVSRYAGEADYSQEVEEVFRRFQHGAARDYRLDYRLPPALGRVGSQILALVADLYPDEFQRLAQFCDRHHDFLWEQVSAAEADLDFYLSYLEHLDPLVSAGLPFCYPTVTGAAAGEEAVQTFDLALAPKLTAEGKVVVLNDFRLDGSERIFVVTGPNQGGKTTFGRTYGQLHHLAGVGCPVPGSSVTLGRNDRIFTHFQHDEAGADREGRLEDDLRRIRRILAAATAESVVVVNEIFASATLDDGRFLGAQTLGKLIALGARGAYVTFVDELAATGSELVSMVSTVADDDPARRTFRIIRAPANGLAYAVALADKYGLTYEQLRGILER